MYRKLQASKEEIKAIKSSSKSAKNIDRITKDGYTISLDGIKFIVPIKTRLGRIKLGKDFRFNNAGILLYSGRNTEGYVNEIAKKYKLDPAKIVLPTKDETDEMCYSQVFRKALLEANIAFIPFIIDKEDETRNVSLKEYWENPDKYRFCVRHTGGAWDGRANPVNDEYKMAVVLGLKK